MYTLEQFKDSGLSLVILHGDQIAFESPGSDLRPLVDYLGRHNTTDKPITILDKYIGRAAATLMALAGASQVHGLIVSEGGAQTLEAAAIPFTEEKRVEYLMGAASRNMCRWEKFAATRTSEELLAELKKTYQF